MQGDGTEVQVTGQVPEEQEGGVEAPQEVGEDEVGEDDGRLTIWGSG